MFAFNLQNTIIAAVAAFFLGATVVGLPAWYYTADYYQTKIKLVAADSATKVAEEVLRLTGDKHDLEDKLKDKGNEIQNKYQKALDDAIADNKRLRSIQLRDPRASNSTNPNTGDKGGTSSTEGADSTQGLLSKQTSGDLWDFATSADTILEQLRVCKDWNSEVKETVRVYGEKVKQVPKK